MTLDWKKVALVVAIVLAFVVLSLAKVLPADASITGMSMLIGWVGGLFTPTPNNKPTIVHEVHDE